MVDHKRFLFKKKKMASNTLLVAVDPPSTTSSNFTSFMASKIGLILFRIFVPVGILALLLFYSIFITNASSYDQARSCGAFFTLTSYTEYQTVYLVLMIVWMIISPLIYSNSYLNRTFFKNAYPLYDITSANNTLVFKDDSTNIVQTYTFPLQSNITGEELYSTVKKQLNHDSSWIWVIYSDSDRKFIFQSSKPFTIMESESTMLPLLGFTQKSTNYSVTSTYSYYDWQTTISTPVYEIKADNKIIMRSPNKKPNLLDRITTNQDTKFLIWFIILLFFIFWKGWSVGSYRGVGYEFSKEDKVSEKNLQEIKGLQKSNNIFVGIITIVLMFLQIYIVYFNFDLDVSYNYDLPIF